MIFWHLSFFAVEKSFQLVKESTFLKSIFKHYFSNSDSNLRFPHQLFNSILSRSWMDSWHCSLFLLQLRNYFDFSKSQHLKPKEVAQMTKEGSQRAFKGQEMYPECAESCNCILYEKYIIKIFLGGIFNVFSQI